MHDCCDLYFRLLDDVDLLFSQYSGSDSYVRKQSTVRDPADTVRRALSAISEAMRLSRKNYRDLTSQLMQTYLGINDTIGSETPELLRQMSTYTTLHGLYAALDSLTPLISGKRNELFDGASPTYKSRIVEHLEKAVSDIASAVRDIQDSMYRGVKKSGGGEKYYKHASRAVFACVDSLLRGHVYPASADTNSMLSFSGIKAAIRLVLLLSDATPHEHIGTAARVSTMQFEHCIEELAKAHGIEQWAPDNEHQIALSAFKFAVNAYADSQGVPLSSSPEEDSVLQQRFTNFHLMEASSYVDYMIIKAGVYAYVLDAYESGHDNRQGVYDCSGEISDLECALDGIDTLIDGMLDANNGGSVPFYSSPTVRKSIKALADSFALLLAKVCTWGEAWHILGGGSEKIADERAAALYDVLQKSRGDFVFSVERALELFTISMCRLDDVHYSRSAFPLVAAWDPCSLPIFPGEYARAVGNVPRMAGAESFGVPSYSKITGLGDKFAEISSDLDDFLKGFEVPSSSKVAGFSGKFAGISDDLDNFFKRDGHLLRDRALGRSVFSGEAISSGGDMRQYEGAASGSTARARDIWRKVVLSQAFSEVVSSGVMQSCTAELEKKVWGSGKEKKHRSKVRSAPAESASTSRSNYLTVPETRPRKCRTPEGYVCDMPVDLGEEFSSSALPRIIVTGSTETPPHVAAGAKNTSTNSPYTVSIVKKEVWAPQEVSPSECLEYTSTNRPYTVSLVKKEVWDPKEVSPSTCLEDASTNPCISVSLVKKEVWHPK